MKKQIHNKGFTRTPKFGVNLQSKRGFTFVEIIVGASVCLIVLVVLMQAFATALKLSLSNTNRVQATFLEEEGIEAARILRDNSWTSNIASQTAGTPFYLAFSSGTWQATTTNTYIGGVFERKVVLNNVYRDGSQNIVSSGGSLDSNTKLVTVYVSWGASGATTTRSLSTYLSNLFNN